MYILNSFCERGRKFPISGHRLDGQPTINEVLRRSAGVPFAVMAMVRAEPRGVPRVLFPLVMEKLLLILATPEQTQGDTKPDGEHSGSASSEIPKIHAFNSLLHVSKSDVVSYHLVY